MCGMSIVEETIDPKTPSASDTDSKISCISTGDQADLFIRNGVNRLVPLSRKIYDKVKVAAPLLKGKISRPGFEWLSGDLVEIPLEAGLTEYKSQPLSESEQRRKDRYAFLNGIGTDFLFAKLVWSDSEPVSDENILKFIPEDKKELDWKISRLEKYPKDSISTAVLATKELTPDNIKALWDSYLKKP